MAVSFLALCVVAPISLSVETENTAASNKKAGPEEANIYERPIQETSDWQCQQEPLMEFS